MEYKNEHLLPPFILLTDACNEIKSVFDTPSYSMESLILLMAQHYIDAHFFVLNWDFTVDVFFAPSAYREISDREERSDFYRNWLKENRELSNKIQVSTGEWLSDFSYNGLFCGIKCSHLLRVLSTSEIATVEDFNVYDHLGNDINLMGFLESEIRLFDFPADEYHPVGISLGQYKDDSTNSLPRVSKDDAAIICIKKEQLYIAKSDFIRIIKNDFKKDKPQSLEPSEPELIRKPAGVSPQKRAAQAEAKTLAKYFWQQDIEQKIKIKEMAVNVYAALSQMGHMEQLPYEQESLKEWIKDVAPEYARQAGKPRSTN